MLASEDGGGFFLPIETAFAGNDGQKEKDLALIQLMITQIDSLIASGRASEAELLAMEEALNRLLEKYKTGPAR
jgi:hypothetical protein